MKETAPIKTYPPLQRLSPASRQNAIYDAVTQTKIQQMQRISRFHLQWRKNNIEHFAATIFSFLAFKEVDSILSEPLRGILCLSLSNCRIVWQNKRSNGLSLYNAIWVMSDLWPPQRKSRSLLIAGGTDGIGFALLYSELQRSKYLKIFVLGRVFQKVDQLLEQQQGTDKTSREAVHQRIVKLPCDITKLDEIFSLLAKIKDDPIHDFVLTIGSFLRGTIADVMPHTATENNDDQTHGDDVVADHFHLNCVSTIHLIRLVVPKLVKGDSQILVCTASLAIMARSPYALQSATKAALRSFVDTLRIELKGRTRVMNLMPPSVDTKIFAKAGDYRNTDGYPPPSRIANIIQYMLDCPPDICIPEMLIEQHNFDANNE